MANVIPFSFRSELLSGTHNFASGGNTLGSQSVTISSAVSYVDFADSTWSSATFTAAFGVIYNNSASDKLVVVLDFGGSKTCTNGTFKVTMPDPSTPTDAIISMS